MASIDKTSIRQQVDKLQQTFDELSKSGKITPETKALCQAMFMLIQVILAVFMEKNTKKNSKNSGIPPSQSDPDESSDQPSRATSKKRTMTENKFSSRSETVTIEDLFSDQCEDCGTNLSEVQTSSTERRTLIDITFEKRVYHVDAHTKVCPACDRKNKPSHPAPFQGNLQYGMGLKVFALDLLVAQMLPYKRTQELLYALCDQQISEATLLKYVSQLHKRLAGWEERTFQTLLQRSAINTDETSMRIDGKNHWVHVYSSGAFTLKKIHKKRGTEAMDEIGFIPQYKGTIILSLIHI